MREHGGVTVITERHAAQLEPVRIAEIASGAVHEGDLVIVVVPYFGHEVFAGLLAQLRTMARCCCFWGREVDGWWPTRHSPAQQAGRSRR